MAEYITRVRTASGDKQIDYNALANLPTLATSEASGLMSADDKKRLEASAKGYMIQTFDNYISFDLIGDITCDMSEPKNRIPVTIFARSQSGHDIQINLTVSLRTGAPLINQLSYSGTMNATSASYSTTNSVTTYTIYFDQPGLYAGAMVSVPTCKLAVADHNIKLEGGTKMACLNLIPTDYVTTSGLESKGYLTSIPDTYITESELESKGYLTSVSNATTSSAGLMSAEDKVKVDASAKGYMVQTYDNYINFNLIGSGEEITSPKHRIPVMIFARGQSGVDIQINLTVSAENGAPIGNRLSYSGTLGVNLAKYITVDNVTTYTIYLSASGLYAGAHMLIPSQCGLSVADNSLVVEDGTEIYYSNLNSALNVYPVGAIYISGSSQSPASLFGGTWEALTDRFLIGAGNKYAAYATGGKSDYNLAAAIGAINGNQNTLGYKSAEVYAFQHLAEPTYSFGGLTPATFEKWSHSTVVYDIESTTTTVTNMPPYLSVYMWRRTA